MRHPNKETVLNALRLIKNTVSLEVTALLLDNRGFSKELSNKLTDYVNTFGKNHTKAEQYELDKLRRWLANGAKVKEYEVCGDYGYGPEMLTTEVTKKEAIEQRKCYDKNEPNVRHSIRPVYDSLIY